MAKGGWKRVRPYGLSAKTFPRPIQWQVDQDYLEKLTPEEQQWLGAFNDSYYGRRIDPSWSLEEVRAVWQQKNAARRDEYSVSPPHLGVDENTLAQREQCDVSPTPEYLDSPEYKKALAEYRAHLNPFRDYKPKDSPGLRAARSKLEKCIERDDEE